MTPERIYHIRTEREDELVDWVNSIRKQQAELLLHGNGSGSGGNASSFSLAPASNPTVIGTASPMPPAPTGVVQQSSGAGNGAPAAPANHDVRVCLCVLRTDINHYFSL